MLGGTHHVGRCFVEAALARGHDVVTLNRGTSGVETPGVDVRHADRLDDEAVARALGDDTFDAVVDTWSWAPSAVRGTARLLSGRAGHYTYVSSRSVYAWPPPAGADESAPVVDGDPASSRRRRLRRRQAGWRAGGDGGVRRTGRAAARRPDPGPVRVVGRLPFWLHRIERGGRVPVPGPPDRPLQLVDARDLADWVLDHRPVGTLQHGQPPRPHHDRRAARGVRPRHRLRRRAGLADPGGRRGVGGLAVDRAADLDAADRGARRAPRLRHLGGARRRAARAGRSR